jgi:hypothetical protein
MIKILHNVALFWVKNANFFAEFFGENIFKIITSVPGQVVRSCPCSSPKLTANVCQKSNKDNNWETRHNAVLSLFMSGQLFAKVASWCTYLQTKNPNLGKFWRVLQWKILVYIMVIWSIFRPFGLFSVHLVYFQAIWYSNWQCGIFCGHLVYFPLVFGML